MGKQGTGKNKFFTDVILNIWSKKGFMRVWLLYNVLLLYASSNGYPWNKLR
jgi:hypothetical protein